MNRLNEIRKGKRAIHRACAHSNNGDYFFAGTSWNRVSGVVETAGEAEGNAFGQGATAGRAGGGRQVAIPEIDVRFFAHPMAMIVVAADLNIRLRAGGEVLTGTIVVRRLVGEGDSVVCALPGMAGSHAYQKWDKQPTGQNEGSVFSTWAGVFPLISRLCHRMPDPPQHKRCGSRYP